MVLLTTGNVILQKIDFKSFITNFQKFSEIEAHMKQGLKLSAINSLAILFWSH